MKKVLIVTLLFTSILFAFNNQKVKYYTIEDNGIKATIEYPNTITAGKKFKIKVSMYNYYSYARMGGFTLSFPQIRHMNGRVYGGTFDQITSYGPPDKIYSGIKKKNIVSKYFMTEGWEYKWKKNVKKTFIIELQVPSGLNSLDINARGILIVGKNKRNSKEIIVPISSNAYDQQGYAVKRLTIPIINSKRNSTKKQSSRKKIEEKRDFIGTGFFVDNTYLLTNNHVVKGCKSIELIRDEYKSNAKIKAYDVINDLAILKADISNASSLQFRGGKGIRIGNDIIVIGYPLGYLLGSGIKLTTGNVSALTGLINDTTNLQLTAPVQPGNSGGPLLDKGGNVVGIVVARLKNEQNVNLAIKANVAQMFLDIHEVDYKVDKSGLKKEVADIADEAKKSIVQVICHQ